MSLWSRIEKRLTSFADDLFVDEHEEQIAEARRLLGAGDAEAARTLAESVLETSPGRPDAAILVAAALWSAGSVDTATTRLTEVLARHDHPEIRLALSRMLVSLQRTAPAMSHLQALQEQKIGRRAEVDCLLSRCFLAEGQYAEAMREINASVTMDPSDEVAQSVEFFCQVALAVTQGQEAPVSPQVPEEPFAQTVLAAANVLAGRAGLGDEEGEVDLSSPDKEATFFGLVATSNGDSARLVDALGTRDDLATKIAAARALEEIGQLSRALDIYEEALPHSGQWLRGKVLNVALRHKDYVRAQTLATNALQVNRDDIVAQEVLARSYVAQGNWQTGLSMLQQLDVRASGLADDIVLYYIDQGQLRDVLSFLQSHGHRLSDEGFEASIQAVHRAADAVPSNRHSWRDFLVDSAMAPTFAQLSHEQTPFTKPLRLVVAGEFSAGKSSLINRLVGQEVLPVGAIPVTDKPTELVVGQQVSVVFIDENGRVLETADSMTGSHPAQAVRAIVRVPEPLLGEVIIIDTPGINTAVGGDEQTLWLEVSGCDAVLWVFRASQAGKKSEKEFLSKLAARDIPVYGVINKTDLIEEQAREQVRASLQEGLGEYLSRLHVASATADSTKSLRKRVLEPVLEQSQTLRNGSELRRWRKVVAREVTRLNSGIEALTELNHRDRPSADFDINAEIRKWQVGVKKVLQWCMSMAETQESRGYKKATLRAEDIDFMRHRAETVLEVLAMQCLDAALHDARRLQGDAVYLGQAQCRSAAKDVLVQAEVTAHAKVSSIIHTALFSPGIVEAFRSRNNGGLAARFDFIEKRCQEVLESVGQQSFSRLLEQVDNARERVKRSLALEKLKKEFTQRFAESLRV